VHLIGYLKRNAISVSPALSWFSWSVHSAGPDTAYMLCAYYTTEES